VPTTETLKLLGKRIQQLRKAKDMTQAELAEACDLSNNFIALMERGRAAPSIGTLDRLGKALHVSLADLFEFPVKSTRPGEQEEITRKLKRINNRRDLRLIGGIVEVFLEMGK